MKLFLIKRLETDYIGYDEYAGFVIAAERNGQARRMAIGQAADEGSEAWVRATCTQIGEAAPYDVPTIVLRDYRAG